MVYRPTEKTQARKHSQHSLLLSSALRIVAIRGFQGLTIAALAKEADVATGTVYKYFKSKTVLCAEVFRLGSEKEVQKVQVAALSDRKVSCIQRLSAAIQIFAERAIKGRHLAYALIAEPVDPSIENERLVYRKAYAEIFEVLISEGIEKGEFYPQNPKVSAAAVVGTLAETLVGPVGPYAPDANETEQQQLIEDMESFCLRAIKNTVN